MSSPVNALLYRDRLQYKPGKRDCEACDTVNKISSKHPDENNDTTNNSNPISKDFVVSP